MDHPNGTSEVQIRQMPFQDSEMHFHALFNCADDTYNCAVTPWMFAQKYLVSWTREVDAAWSGSL